MSLNGSLWLNSTAMAAQSQALGAIADNISNLNTAGYRKRTVAFSELLGHTNKYQTKSTGTQADVTTRVEAGGAYTHSDRGLSAALGGRALFPVSKNTTGTDLYYTRNGAFDLVGDDTGTMRIATGGYYLMGWPVSDTGTVTKTLETITAPNRTDILPAVASTSAALSDNLSASASIGDQAVRSVPVYDATGTIHSIDLTFTNTGPSSWNVTAASTSGTLALATSPLPITFDNTGHVTGTSSVALSGTWSNSETAAISLDFSNMTQWGDEQVQRSMDIDGAPNGYVSSYYFDDDGFLNVSYSNGGLRRIYQIPGAVFPNANGLSEYSGDVFKTSPDSGDPTMIDPQSSGLGSFMSGTLELSNVDLATEMTNLIQTQRAYSTAATAFRTVDEMITTMRDLT